jgi:hypothetical protein
MKRVLPAALLALAFAASAASAKSSGSAPSPDPLIARGRYLVGFGSCNDCHTPGWRESDGTVPLAQWMTGSKLGYRGPWGTSYPSNVRLEFQRISEDAWLSMVRTRGGHWPMVWHDLRLLALDDQRAIYRFVKSLGAKGVPAPADLPSGIEPSTPYIWVVPHT